MSEPQPSVTQVSVDGLVPILSRIRSATPIYLEALTAVDCRKTDNPHFPLYKLTKVQAMTGFNWENSVNRARDTQSQSAPVPFAAQPRSWGERVSPALIAYKHRYYLRTRLLRTEELGYWARTQDGMLLQVDRSKVLPFLPHDPDRATRQGLVEAVQYRDWQLGNIRVLTMLGERYRIGPDDLASTHQSP